MEKKRKPGWSLWKDAAGKIHPYPHNRYGAKIVGELTEVDSRDCEFIGALQLTSVSYGHFYFKDINTKQDYMAQETEIEKILLNSSMEKGLVFGKWGWVKRGRVVSIKLITELDDEEEGETDGS